MTTPLLDNVTQHPAFEEFSKIARLSRESGNIKDEADAEETVESLFQAFPVVK